MAIGKQLQKIVEILIAHYEVEGKNAELTSLRDPFQLGAWYILGQHAKRNSHVRAYDALRRAKGITPGQLLNIPEEKLTSIAKLAGPYEDACVKDLYAYADQIEEKCGQDFSQVFKSQAGARKFLETTLRKPRPFVDFLLLYGGRFQVFPVDFRVARVVTRLGFGKMKSPKEMDKKSCYDLQEILESESIKDTDWLIRAHSVLYRYGADTCHDVRPVCKQCPLTQECLYLKKHPLSCAV
ncbi:MAG: hypothetical protein V1899_08180 [Planctomycetota bacterium]